MGRLAAEAWRLSAIAAQKDAAIAFRMSLNMPTKTDSQKTDAAWWQRKTDILYYDARLSYDRFREAQ